MKVNNLILSKYSIKFIHYFAQKPIVAIRFWSVYYQKQRVIKSLEIQKCDYLLEAEKHGISLTQIQQKGFIRSIYNLSTFITAQDYYYRQKFNKKQNQDQIKMESYLYSLIVPNLNNSKTLEHENLRTSYPFNFLSESAQSKVISDSYSAMKLIFGFERTAHAISLCRDILQRISKNEFVQEE